MAFTACRHITLDKCAGVRPIGSGEVCRSIIGKAIIKRTKHDIQNAVGSLQLCTGEDADCDAAVMPWHTFMLKRTLKWRFSHMLQMTLTD